MNQGGETESERESCLLGLSPRPGNLGSCYSISANQLIPNAWLMPCDYYRSDGVTLMGGVTLMI